MKIKGSALPVRAALGLSYAPSYTKMTPIRHLVSPEMTAPAVVATGGFTERTETVKSTVMVTPVAGQTKIVSSATTSMSATTAERAEEGRRARAWMEGKQVGDITLTGRLLLTTFTTTRDAPRGSEPTALDLIVPHNVIFNSAHHHHVEL